MKKSKQQEELEEGLESGEENEPQQEVVENDEELEESIEEEVPVELEVPVQKGLTLETAPAQFSLIDRETREEIVYANDIETLDRGIALKTLEYARETAINSRKE